LNRLNLSANTVGGLSSAEISSSGNLKLLLSVGNFWRFFVHLLQRLKREVALGSSSLESHLLATVLLDRLEGVIVNLFVLCSCRLCLPTIRDSTNLVGCETTTLTSLSPEIFLNFIDELLKVKMIRM